jgi:hypothetical protein
MNKYFKNGAQFLHVSISPLILSYFFSAINAYAQQKDEGKCKIIAVIMRGLPWLQKKDQ